jgi:hypothetical protein
VSIRDILRTGRRPGTVALPEGEIQTTEVMTVFVELTDDLLDLNVTTKGVGNALLASVEEGAGGSSSCTLSSSLCCSFHLCI